MERLGAGAARRRVVSTEAAAIIITLAVIGFMLWEIRSALHLIAAELSTARWERSVIARRQFPDPEETD